MSLMIKGKYQSKTLIIIQLMLLQQFTGINAFISYADIIFVKVFGNYLLFKNFAMTIGIVQLVFTVAGMFFIDRFGRKSFLKINGVVMALSLFIMAISFKVSSLAFCSAMIKYGR